MAIDALNTAAQGLLSSERRATQIAQDIVTTSAGAVNALTDAVDASSTVSSSDGLGGAANVNAPASGASTPLAGGAGFGDVIQQLVDLRLEENIFRANASAFSRINDTFGSLLDQES